MRNTFWTLLAAYAIAFVGCGKPATFDISGPTGTVTGKVTLDGNSVPPGCSVTFRHTLNGHAAFGQVADDGSFTLQLGDSLRLPTGVYTVGVTAPAPANMSTQEVMKASLEKKNSGQSATIPAKFQNPNTSPLKLEVVEGSNTLDVKMTSK